ncbi:MAG: type II toxin-antitoxin system RelE/ParE family toxin [Nannocystaceae bacterium]
MSSRAPLTIHEAALREIDAALEWYQREGPSVVVRLRREISATIDRARDFPRSGAPARVNDPGDLRLFPLRGFPFVIVTALEADARMVVAFAHTRREPGYWKARIG